MVSGEFREVERTDALGVCEFTIAELEGLLDALEDAVAYLEDDGAFCGDCERVYPEWCEDHRNDNALADSYDRLCQRVSEVLEARRNKLSDTLDEVIGNVDDV